MLWTAKVEELFGMLKAAKPSNEKAGGRSLRPENSTKKSKSTPSSNFHTFSFAAFRLTQFLIRQKWTFPPILIHDNFCAAWSYQIETSICDQHNRQIWLNSISSSRLSVQSLNKFLSEFLLFHENWKFTKLFLRNSLESGVKSMLSILDLGK